MVTDDMTIVFGGDAGQGIRSTGLGFIKANARSGLFPFGRQDYKSRIRGGHNFFEIRVAREEIYSHTEGIDLLVAITEETVTEHLEEIVAGGGIIYDEGLDVNPEELKNNGVEPYPVPLNRIAMEEGGAKIMANTAAIGAIVGLTGFDLSYIEGIIEENFAVKGDEVVQNNLDVARAGVEYVDSHGYSANYHLEPVPESEERMVINGNQAFALGAVAGGCNFVSAYPMTPSTSILEWITKHSQELSIVTKQPESELAAVNMAIGASHVGARALVTTSGGGFSLMVEALGLAGMTETPLVIAEVSRPGPSTGLPTRTGQGDLMSVVHASQGDFPRIVLTPGTISEAFQAGARSFNLAEKYQTPVITLSDQHLADSIRAVDPGIIDMEGVEIDRGELLTEEELDSLEGTYLRHEFTETGVSPRALPGHENAVYKTTGNEHTEKGDITEDPEIRMKMMDKRAKKAETALENDIESPIAEGPEDAEISLLCWGSTYGAAKEAIERLPEKGVRANLCHLRDAWPFPAEEVTGFLDGAEKTVLVEGNGSGEMKKLISQETGRVVDHEVLKYDGRPFTPDYIVEKVEEVI